MSKFSPVSPLSIVLHSILLPCPRVLLLLNSGKGLFHSQTSIPINCLLPIIFAPLPPSIPPSPPYLQAASLSVFLSVCVSHITCTHFHFSISYTSKEYRVFCSHRLYPSLSLAINVCALIHCNVADGGDGGSGDRGMFLQHCSPD